MPTGENPARAVVNFQVSDVDVLAAFLDRVVNLHGRLERGEVMTVQQAADELGKILSLNEGERLG